MPTDASPIVQSTKVRPWSSVTRQPLARTRRVGQFAGKLCDILLIVCAPPGVRLDIGELADADDVFDGGVRVVVERRDRDVAAVSESPLRVDGQDRLAQGGPYRHRLAAHDRESAGVSPQA